MAKPIQAGAREKEITEIATVRERIRTGELSPVELVNACLERIERINPKLNAFITVLAEQAREQARMAESELKAGKWRGALHGIPVGIKDFYDRPGSKRPLLLSISKTACPEKMPLASPSLRMPGRSSLGK